MEIRDYKVGDENHIKELFELVFKQAYSIDLWNWRFQENPTGKRKIKLMWVGDKLVGQYAVSPVQLVVEGEIKTFAHSLATMTHPEYGRRGIFTSLAKDLYKKLEEEGFEGVYGFPNNNSHRGFVKSLDWKNLGIQHSLSISKDKLNYKSSQELDMDSYKFEEFNQEHEDFISLMRKTNAVIYVRKNVEYLNWRYVLKPKVTYHKYYGSTSNNSRFLIVTKVYEDRTSNNLTLNILEGYFEDVSQIASLVLGICNSINNRIGNVSLWASLFGNDHIVFEKQGFSLSTPQAYVGLLPFNSERFNTDFRNWRLTMGDSDVF